MSPITEDADERLLQAVVQAVLERDTLRVSLCEVQSYCSELLERARRAEAELAALLGGPRHDTIPAPANDRGDDDEESEERLATPSDFVAGAEFAGEIDPRGRALADVLAHGQVDDDEPSVSDAEVPR